MAMLGTITQLPQDFFLRAETLAGAANQVAADKAEVTAGDHETEEHAADVIKDRQAPTLTFDEICVDFDGNSCVFSATESHTGESRPSCMTCGVGKCFHAGHCEPPSAQSGITMTVLHRTDL